jgi:hypothetical protein
MRAASVRRPVHPKAPSQAEAKLLLFGHDRGDAAPVCSPSTERITISRLMAIASIVELVCILIRTTIGDPNY